MGFCLGWLFFRVFSAAFPPKKTFLTNLVILVTIGPSYVTDGTGAGSRAFSSASAENPWKKNRVENSLCVFV